MMPRTYRLSGAIALGLLCTGIPSAGFAVTNCTMPQQAAASRLADGLCPLPGRLRAVADKSRGYRLAQQNAPDCSARCTNDLNACLGIAPNAPQSSSSDNDGDKAEKPPSFEQCIQSQNDCMAACGNTPARR